uniref:Uncharacterized protein n=1 Tax=Physcomitrium patens TaxID=3218 RepID=A0A2K1KJC9_PHYPA|nr:hypothetical protein PHYPA_007548 [Physcomitrium patens]
MNCRKICNEYFARDYRLRIFSSFVGVLLVFLKTRCPGRNHRLSSAVWSIHYYTSDLYIGVGNVGCHACRRILIPYTER